MIPLFKWKGKNNIPDHKLFSFLTKDEHLIVFNMMKLILQRQKKIMNPKSIEVIEADSVKLC